MNDYAQLSGLYLKRPAVGNQLRLHKESGFVSELRKPKSSEMCPPGYHVVHGHERVRHSGTVTWVDAHVRRNRGKIKPGLLIENTHYLFWNSKKKYPSLKSIDDYPRRDEYDSLIQFWLEYWKSQGIKF